MIRVSWKTFCRKIFHSVHVVFFFLSLPPNAAFLSQDQATLSCTYISIYERYYYDFLSKYLVVLASVRAAIELWEAYNNTKRWSKYQSNWHKSTYTKKASQGPIASQCSLPFLIRFITNRIFKHLFKLLILEPWDGMDHMCMVGWMWEGGG